MNLDKKLFCFAPFYSLTIEGNGFIRTCAATHHSICHLEDLSNSASYIQHTQLKQIKESFQKGTFPENCKVCERKEAKGYKSRRLKINQQFNLSNVDFEFENKNVKLKDLDISFSNVCNLNCTMCSSRYSTSWLKADEKFLRSPSMFKDRQNEIKGFQEKHQMSDDNFKVLQSIYKENEIERILIKGGEPLFDKQCHKFLKFLREQKFDGELWIVTNGQYLNEEVIILLQGIKNLNISLSVDGTGDTYEWIRGKPFKTLIKNFKTLNEIGNLDKISISFTASVHNVHNIVDFMDWDRSLRKSYPKYVGANYLQYAIQAYLNCNNLSISSRMNVVNEIKNKHLSFYGDAALTNLFNYLQQESSAEVSKYLAWTHYCNSLRDKDIFSIHPQLNTGDC